MNQTNALFLTDDMAREIVEKFSSPLYVYDEEILRSNIRKVTSFPNAYGLKTRYAMKACPTAKILRTVYDEGMKIDASSGYEAMRAMKVGIAAKDIQITAQEIPSNLEELVNLGVLYNACSLQQLKHYGELFPNTAVSIRLNPGIGSGHNNRTNVGGVTSSFGIWHEYLDQAIELAKNYQLKIERVHTHIGSGADSGIWKEAASLSLELCERISDATLLSLGGGFKVGRMEHEVTSDLNEIGEVVKQEYIGFYEKTGRKLEVEIEPGNYVVSSAGAILSEVDDIVDTGEEGFKFVKLNTGMTDIIRPSMYGGQHPVSIIAKSASEPRETEKCLVVGHCCESGDILTTLPADPEGLLPTMMVSPEIGDIAVIGHTGAYCSSMSAKNYNSFPESAEILITVDKNYEQIRLRQSLDQMLQNEIV